MAGHNARGNDSADFRARLERSRRLGPDAIGQLLEVYRPYLLGIANDEINANLRGKAGASDLVQQTFLEANQDLVRFQGTTEAELLAWLRRILLNNIASFRRQFRPEGKRAVAREVPMEAGSSVLPLGELPASDPSPSAEAVAREDVDAIEQALARLPEDYRQTIVMRHQQHCSFAEIGAALGRSADAARKLWVRAIEALQAELNT